MPILRDYLDTRSISYQDVFGKGGSWTGGRKTASGKTVGRESAMRLSTVYSCVTLISDVWSSLPLEQYRKSSEGASHRGRAIGERIAGLSEQEDRSHGIPADPAPWIEDPSGGGRGETAFSLTEGISISLSTGGNFYGEVLTGGRFGDPIAILTLDPQRVEPLRRLPNGRILFAVTLDSGETVPVEQDRRGMTTGILHIPGPRMPGSLAGMAPLELAREAIGLGLTAEQFGAEFFGNGARPDVVIELAEGTKATPEVMDRLRTGWSDRHSGEGNRHRPGVLSDGASLKEIQIPPDHAQFLETREFQRSDIASWFRCPPHLVGIVSKSTSWGTGLEEQSQGFGRYTLAPLAARCEPHLSNLIPRGQFVAWNMAGLDRASLLKRYQAYAIGRNGGWLSTNDIRLDEDLPPIEGGDEYLQPLNMEPIGATIGEDGPPTKQTTEEDS
jgi:HK97 family phage portal protein